MERSHFEQLRVYRLAEQLADRVWAVVSTWDSFTKTTIGMQRAWASDSVRANIAEGEGRGSFANNRRFVRTARGSLNETKHFLRCAFQRGLLSPDQIAALNCLTQRLGPMLNAYLKSIGSPGAPQPKSGAEPRAPRTNAQCPVTSDP